MGARFKPHDCHDFATERRDRRSVRLDELERWRSYLTHCRAYHKYDLHGHIQDAILPDDDPWDRWHGKSRQRVEKQRIECLD